MLGCIRMLLIILNSIFAVIGLAVMGVGIWVLVDFSAILQYFPEELAADDTLIKGAGIACVSLGVFVFLIAIFGCFGAKSYNRFMLSIFSGLMVVVIIAVLVGAIVALVDSSLIEDIVTEALDYEVANNVTDGLLKFASDELHCCGIINEFNATCPMTYPGTNCTVGSAACAKGCQEAIWGTWFSPYIDTAVIVLFCLSGVMIIITMMALYQCVVGRGGSDEYGYHHH